MMNDEETIRLLTEHGELLDNDWTVDCVKILVKYEFKFFILRFYLIELEVLR